MKIKILFFIQIFLMFDINGFAQPGDWTWIKGDSMPNQIGNFGVQGIPSITNTPPSLYEPCEWTDQNGKFWMFGGSGIGYYSDLWKYDPSSNIWTWMKGPGIPYDSGHYGIQGVSSPNNNPCQRIYAFASWVDNQDNLWFFGGQGQGNDLYSDLWKYSIITNQWTWMKGPNIPNQIGIYGTQGVSSPNNNPGARIECAAAWNDSLNNLWFFGGYAGGIGRFNDLWRYSTSLNEWTWMKGSSIADQPGNYGIKGLENLLNDPPARWSHCRWKDTDGKFWLFGSVAFTVYNDLWRFNTSTNSWAWMSGDSTTNSLNVYGAKCIPASTNMPGGRRENRAAWIDPQGNLFFMGGSGPFIGTRNDLWKYCINSNQWIWIGGDSTANPLGNWGTLGVGNPTNKPNKRAGAIGWTDNGGHLYFFGGSSSSHQNDLWKFTIDTTCGVCPTSSDIHEVISQNQEIEVFPNPTYGELTIIVHKNNLQKVKVTLINLLGEKLFIETENSIDSNWSKTINIRNFPNGIYFLELTLNNDIIVRKVLKN